MVNLILSKYAHGACHERYESSMHNYGQLEARTSTACGWTKRATYIFETTDGSSTEHFLSRLHESISKGSLSLACELNGMMESSIFICTQEQFCLLYC